MFRRKPTPDPVRPDQVQRLTAAMAAEDDAILCDEGPSGARELRAAQAVRDAVERNSTPAEIQAAHHAR